MKKFIFILFCFIICIIGFTIYSKQNITEIEPTLEEKLNSLGYSKNDIQIIHTLKNPKIVLQYDYNKKIIEIIQNDDFKEQNLDKYIEFSSLYELDLNDVIYLVNHNYYNQNLEYTDKVVSLMKQEYFIYGNLDRYLNYNGTNTIEFSNIDYESEYIIKMVNSKRDYEYYTHVENTDLSKGYLMLVNKYNKLDSSYIPENMVTIDSKYGIQAQLEKTVYEAYLKMWEDASKEGLYLYIRSPYRSYTTQNNLYERYAAQDGYQEADTYSARPGYSEHQTGLAFDVTTKSTTLGTFETTKEFRWLKENAYKYGFILRYPKGKENITGYVYESWHYRYVGTEAAKVIYEKDLTFEEYYEYYVK